MKMVQEISSWRIDCSKSEDKLIDFEKWRRHLVVWKVVGFHEFSLLVRLVGISWSVRWLCWASFVQRVSRLWCEKGKNSREVEVNYRIQRSLSTSTHPKGSISTSIRCQTPIHEVCNVVGIGVSLYVVLSWIVLKGKKDWAREMESVEQLNWDRDSKTSSKLTGGSHPMLMLSSGWYTLTQSVWETKRERWEVSVGDPRDSSPGSTHLRPWCLATRVYQTLESQTTAKFRGSTICTLALD